MVVEVIDAPWAGVPVRIWWFKRRWICRETTCQTATFLEHDERMCAPRARLGTRTIELDARTRRGRTPGAPGDPPTVAFRGSHYRWPGSTTGNHVEYRVVPYQAVPARPHLMTLPVSQACGCWGLMSMCGTTKTDAAGGPVSSPASWT